MKYTRNEWERYFNMECNEDVLNLCELEYLQDYLGDNFEDYIVENNLEELVQFLTLEKGDNSKIL